MKNKTKLMLALSILTAGTLAAGATGTFAWFTTNKTATATYNNISIKGTSGSLNVAITGVTNKDAKASAGTNVTASAAGSYASDVSSADGIKFYQPDWKNKSGNAEAVNKIKDVSTSAGYFTQYLVTVSNASAGDNVQSLDIYLSKLTITTSDNTDVAKWVRVAITTIASNDNGYLKAGDGSQTFVLQNTVSIGTNDKYINGTTLKGGNLMDLQSLSTDVLKEAGENMTAIKPTAWKDVKEANVSSGSSRTFGVSVWIEGTIEDDQQTAIGSTISVSMELSSEDHVGE